MVEQLDAAGVWRNPVGPRAGFGLVFYRAEDYHQQYFRNHPRQPYGTLVVATKLKKFREKFVNKQKRSA